VVLALVAGLQIVRQMIGLTALAQCPPSTLAEILRPVFQQLWAGDGTPALPTSRAKRRPLR
jgi:hypothetical protein